MAGGRPTKYTKDIGKLARDYIDSCEDGFVTDTYIEFDGKRKRKIVTRKFVVNLPTVEGLALALRISRETVYAWKKIYPEFSDIVEDLLAKQANRLVNKGISGDYNPTISKVMMTKHGYREGLEHTGNEGTDLFKPTKEDQERSKAALKDM